MRRYGPVLAVVFTLLGAAALPAGAAAAHRISLYGYGPAKWGMTQDEVASALGVSFSCSYDPCICPDSSPKLPVTLSFGDGTLGGLFAYRNQVRTTRGIRWGSTARKALRKYRGSRLVRNGALTSGLSDFVVVRGGGHALAFQLNDRDRVVGIDAFQSSSVESEMCG